MAMCLATTARGQVALPEAVISGPGSYMAVPVLIAAGPLVIGGWQGFYGDPRFQLEVRGSLDGGQQWNTITGVFDTTPPYNSVPLPHAIAVHRSGQIQLTANGGLIGYRHSGPLDAPWLGPTLPFPLAGLGVGAIPSLVTSEDGTRVYALMTSFYSFSGAGAGSVWLARSLDGGVTWQPPVAVSDSNSVGTSAVVAPDGSILVVFMDIRRGEVRMARSTDQGASFAPSTRVGTANDNLGLMPLGWKPQGDPVYPYYNLRRLAPNFPAIAVDRSPGPTRGNLYVTWAEYADGVASPVVRTIGETPNNDFFETATPIELDSDIGGSMTGIHSGGAEADVFRLDAVAGQPFLISGSSPNGAVFVIYRTHPDCRLIATDVGFLPNPDGFPAQYRIAVPWVYTPLTSGPIYFRFSSASSVNSVSYRLRLQRYTPSAGSASRDQRDIVMVRSTDGGVTWGPKVRVNHDAPGADQHQPNVAVDERGLVYAAWYDRRGSAFGDSVNAYAAVSTNGGQSFGPDQRLSSVPSDWFWGMANGVQHGALIGDRIALAAGTDYGMVAWADMRNSPTRSDIYAARIVGVPTAVTAVSDLSAEAAGEGVRLRWTMNDSRAVSGLRVLRAVVNGAESALGDADLMPGGNGAAEFTDVTAERGAEYDYRLAVRSAGRTEWLGPVRVRVPEQVVALACRAAGPNPFASRTSVRLAVPSAAEGVVRVYDVQGKSVRTLAEGRFEAGIRVLEWDGRDGSGAAAQPGIYFVAAAVGGEQARVRVARVR